MSVATKVTVGYYVFHRNRAGEVTMHHDLFDTEKQAESWCKQRGITKQNYLIHRWLMDRRTALEIEPADE